MIEVVKFGDPRLKGIMFPEKVVIDRSSDYGNPFVMKDKSMKERERVIREYKKWVWNEYQTNSKFMYHFDNDLVFNKKLVYLVCWCAPLPCHGDVIVKMVEYLRKMHRHEPPYKFQDWEDDDFIQPLR